MELVAHPTRTTAGAASRRTSSTLLGLAIAASLALQACGNPPADLQCGAPPSVAITAVPADSITAGTPVRLIASWDAEALRWVPTEIRISRDGAVVDVQATGAVIRGAVSYEWRPDIQDTGSFRWHATAWTSAVFGWEPCSMASQVVTVEVVPAAPTLSRQPQSTTVPEGQSATFVVVATGSAPLSYQWRRDGAEIAGATSEAYTLSNVTLGDSGARFDVIVTNAAGTTQSGFATLTVEERTRPASLDRSFAGTGFVVTTLAGHDLFPHTLVNLPDGRHALVGRARAFDQLEATKLAIAVYRPDGTPDTSVGTDGLIVREVAAWFADRAPAEAFKRVVLAEAPARVAAYHERNGVAGVVVGMLAVTEELGLERYYAVLVRLQLAGAATGSLDPGFGAAGVVRRTSPTDPSWRMTRGVAVDGSQRIYELWTTEGTTASLQGSGSSLLRWRPDGSADPIWGGGGEVVLNDPVNAPGQRVAVLPGGKVLLVGIERDNALRYPIVARFDASGGADTGFGTDGTTRVANAVSFAFLSGIGAAVWDQERDASGRTLLAVSGAGYFYVARLSSNGEFDTSFTDLAAIPGDAGYWRQQAECGLRALPDGRLLAVSYFQSGFSIRRWQADLSALDGSFNRDADGLAEVATVYPFENLSFAGFFCFGTHLQDDGRILIAGRAYGAVAGLPNGFGLVRLRGGEY